MVAKNLMVGLFFGFVLSRIGFYDFDQVNSMFSLTDLRLFLTFCTAVSLLTIGRLLILKSCPKRTLNFQPGIVVGSLFFGIGWALTASCPAIVLLQIAHGQLPSLFTVLGMIIGFYSYRRLNSRFFRWKITSCTDL